MKLHLDSDNPWPTIAEAAKILGLSDRHVRRVAMKMSDSDRQRPTHGPMRVRLSALEACMMRSEAESIESDMSPTLSEMESVLVSVLRQHVQELKADKDRLYALLDKRDQAEAEMRRLLLADRSELARLREQMALAPALQEAIAERETDVDGKTPMPEVKDSGNGTERHWWQIWKRG